MMNGFHHSDTELPAAKNDISVESVFGAKAVGRDPRHVTDVPKNASSQSIPAVFHDEEFGTETPIQYENPEETFRRGASPYAGFGTSGIPKEKHQNNLTGIVIADDSFNGEVDTTNQKYSIDEIFSSGMD